MRELSIEMIERDPQLTVKREVAGKGRRWRRWRSMSKRKEEEEEEEEEEEARAALRRAQRRTSTACTFVLSLSLSLARSLSYAERGGLRAFSCRRSAAAAPLDMLDTDTAWTAMDTVRGPQRTRSPSAPSRALHLGPFARTAPRPLRALCTSAPVRALSASALVACGVLTNRRGAREATWTTRAGCSLTRCSRRSSFTLGRTACAAAPAAGAAALRPERRPTRRTHRRPRTGAGTGAGLLTAAGVAAGGSAYSNEWEER